MLDEAASQPESSKTLCASEPQARHIPRIGERDMRGFKNFLMRGDVIVVAVGLVVALAFSTLITAFTTDLITPLINSFTGSKNGLGVEIRSGNSKTLVEFGTFISAIISFLILMAVVYFLIVVPYKMVQARRGQVVFGDPPPVKTCPACLSSDLPAAASKCKYCGTEQPPVAPAPVGTP
jgi:large conductance mechanosensitive channel